MKRPEAITYYPEANNNLTKLKSESKDRSTITAYVASSVCVEALRPSLPPQQRNKDAKKEDLLCDVCNDKRPAFCSHRFNPLVPL